MVDNRTARYRRIDRALIQGLSTSSFRNARGAKAFHSAAGKSSAVGGFFLVEAILVLMIFGIVIAMTTSYASNAYRIFSGVRAAAQLRYANDVVQEFVLRHAKEIKEQLSETPLRGNLTIKGTAIPIRRVPLEDAKEYAWDVYPEGLSKLAELDGGSPLAPYSAARFSLFPFDHNLDNCKELRKSIKHCRIETLIYRTKPIYHGDATDWVALNAGLRSLKAGGGLSISIAPDAIRFHMDDRVSSFSKNPIASTPGILAIRSEQAPHHRPYLDLRYGHMFGTIDMDGKGIRNAKNIKADQVGLTESNKGEPAKIAFVDSDDTRALKLKATGISTGDWRWQFREIIFARPSPEGRDAGPKDAALAITSFAGGTVQSTRASPYLAITQTLIFTDPVPKNECDGGEIGFDSGKKPVYCNGNSWKPLVKES